MNYKVRIVKLPKDKKSVQVVFYEYRKTKIANHLGSSNEVSEIEILKQKAELWIKEEASKNGLWREETHFTQNYQYLGFTYLYAYEFLERIFKKFNYHLHLSKLFQDLVISRILEPTSKRDSLKFLQEFLNIEHSENILYKKIVKYDEKLKDKIEKEAVEIAKKEFGFDFKFVLYDVTTLYFESFKEYTFQKPGFSKEHKHNQPQIVIGLVVTAKGFPISYQIFKGNENEGKTFLPSILEFKKKNNITNLTVVADSAMFSKQNLDTLVESGLSYIIAARLASSRLELIEKIYKEIKQEDGQTIRLENLVVSYSSKRYRKDKVEFDKQVKKAEENLNTKTERIAKIKYLWNDKITQQLNTDLIEKNRKLLGLKGYLTNLTDKTNQEIVDYYHNLYKIEHAFRIAKSDLETRPIYLQKEESIKNHVLICFVALTISVYLELKNDRSIDSIKREIMSITDAKLFNKFSKEIFFQRVPNESTKLLEKMSY